MQLDNQEYSPLPKPAIQARKLLTSFSLSLPPSGYSDIVAAAVESSVGSTVGGKEPDDCESDWDS